MKSLSFAMMTSTKQRTIIKIQEEKEKSLVRCAKHCGVANVVAPEV